MNLLIIYAKSTMAKRRLIESIKSRLGDNLDIESRGYSMVVAIKDLNKDQALEIIDVIYDNPNVRKVGIK